MGCLILRCGQGSGAAAGAHGHAELRGQGGHAGSPGAACHERVAERGMRQRVHVGAEHVDGRTPRLDQVRHHAKAPIVQQEHLEQAQQVSPASHMHAWSAVHPCMHAGRNGASFRAMKLQCIDTRGIWPMLSCSFGVRWPVASSNNSTASLTSLIHTWTRKEQRRQVRCSGGGAQRQELQPTGCTTPCMVPEHGGNNVH